ncbi:UpxY family transcription antiterminator [Bizionia gelidisalsuginis]|uniref:UpxY family transcription antiterminator n=1 Tax=Bizionia gelidisalsuginis TaxID=291188 RepID=A0ABY3M6W2_9FLAO|nr:UpxY family transcription antiterminator [Bizionia gelidisalsuginis]TYC07803.1 UpxY family transcription antiterminator [Bizionia gelidisalsuginis]
MLEKKWFVLYVKLNHEKKVEKRINAWSDDIVAFCPTRIEERVWSDRKKKIEVPLLPRMVFIHATEKERNRVFDIPFTMRYLYDQGEAGIVRDVEIAHLKSILETPNITSHTVETFTPGETLQLDTFGLENQEGTIVKTTKNNLWVVLRSVGFVVKLQINQ